MIEDGFIFTRSLVTTLVEEVGTSPGLGVITGPLGRGSGAPKEARFETFSNTVLTAVVEAPSTSTGVAMTPTARMAAKKDAKKTLACILNERGVEDRNRLWEWMLKRLIDSQRSP